MAILTAPAPTGGDDQTLLQNFLNSINSGDYASFPQGAVYKHSNRLLYKNAAQNVTIMAEGVQFLATNSRYATFYFNGAVNVEIIGLWHKNQTKPTQRVDLANDVGMFAFNSTSGVRLKRVRATDAAGLSMYFWNAQGGAIDNCIVEGSLADGFHFTNGSGGFTVTDCQALGVGDDAFAHVGYQQDGSTGRPHDIILVRPVVRDCRARSISYSGAYNCTANNVDLDGSLAASVYFATERGDFNTLDTANCTVNGGRMVGAGRSYAAISGGTDGVGKDQGFVLWLASGNGATVVNCVVNDVSVGNAGPANYDTFRAIQYGGTFSGCQANRTQLYNGAPSTYVGGNIPAAISPQTSTNRRSETIPSSSANVGVLGGDGSTTTPTNPNPSTGTRREPSAISGMVSWIRGRNANNLSVGGSVSSVADSSGNGNTATKDTTDAGPTYTATPKGGLSFSGAKQYLREPGASASLNPETIITVVRPTATNVVRSIRSSAGFGATGGQHFAVVDGKTALIKQGIEQVLLGNATVPASTISILTGTYSSTLARLFFNGAADGSRTNPPAPSSGLGSVIGAGYDQNEPWQGDIYEVLTWNRVLTASELAEVHSYFSDEYAVTVADYVAPPVTGYTATAALSGGGTALGSGVIGGVSASRLPVDSIPGTVTVMKADSLSAIANGAAVNSWVDKKNRWTLVAGNAAPTKVAAGALNSKPAVRFNGTTQNLVMNNAPTLAQPFTYGIVIAPTTVTGDRQLIWQGSGGEAAIYQSQWFEYAGGGYSLTSPTPSTGGKVLTYEFAGTSSVIQVNGATGNPATGNPGTAGMTGSQLVVMDHGTVDRYFGGDLYEIRIWDHLLSDAEEAAWHSYCQDEYGVSVADYISSGSSASLSGSGTAVVTPTKLAVSATPVASGSGTLEASGTANMKSVMTDPWNSVALKPADWTTQDRLGGASFDYDRADGEARIVLASTPTKDQNQTARNAASVAQPSTGNVDITFPILSEMLTGTVFSGIGIVAYDAARDKFVTLYYFNNPANQMPQTQFAYANSATTWTVFTNTTNLVNMVPVHLRLRRLGNAWSVFTSMDGTSWLQFGATQTINGFDQTQVGFFAIGGSGGAFTARIGAFRSLLAQTSTAAAPVSGSGTVAPTPRVGTAGTAGATGSGTATASGVAMTTRAVALSGDSFLAPSGRLGYPGSGAASGSGQVVYVGALPGFASAAAPNGSGSIQSKVGSDSTGTAPIAGSGTTTPTTTAMSTTRSAAASGSGTLVATGVPAIGGGGGGVVWVQEGPTSTFDSQADIDANWTALTGTWTIVDGKLTLATTATARFFVHTVDPASASEEIEWTAYRGNSSSYGMMLRYLDANNYYGARWAADTALIFKIRGGTLTSIFSVADVVSDGDICAFRVVDDPITGYPTMWMWRNGVMIGSGIDTGNAIRPAGRIGPRSTSGSVPSQYDNVTIRTLQTTAASPGVPVPVSGSGTAVVAGVQGFSGTAAATGSGSLSAVAQVSQSGSAAATGSGTTTYVATSISGAQAVIALTGSGTTTPAQVASISAAAPLSGSGTTLSTGTATAAGTATASGNGQTAPVSAVTVAGTGVGTGSGSVNAGRLVSFAAATAASGSGSTTTSSTPRVLASANDSGSGTTVVLVNEGYFGTGVATGSGEAQAMGFAGTGRAATATGSGTAVGTGTSSIRSTGAATGSGQMVAVGSPALVQTSSASGLGVVNPTSLVSASGSSAASGSGVLDQSARPAVPSYAGSIGSGVATATGGSANFKASAQLSGSGSLSTSLNDLDLAGTGAATGSGTLVPTLASLAFNPTGAATGSGALISSSIAGQVSEVVRLTGGSQVVPAERTTVDQIQVTTGYGDVATAALITTRGTLVLFGEGTLTGIYGQDYRDIDLDVKPPYTNTRAYRPVDRLRKV